MHIFKRFALDRKALFIRVAAILFTLAIGVLLLSQTVFAQTTYVITDGSRVLIHTTSATDPEDVLGEAGLELGADDTYTTQSGTGTAEIQIQRGQAIHIDYYGEPMDVVSTGETVRQLLTRLNLSWDADDTISAALDADTFDGMELAIARVTRMEQTYSAALHHDTSYCSDPSLPLGTEKVLIPGADGEMLCTATVTYVNGRETERSILTQTVTRHPVEELVAVGTAVEDPNSDILSQLPVITDNTITLSTGEVLTYSGMRICYATAYCDKGLTATGTQARVGEIAVDPRVIPYGTRMFIMSEDGEYIYGIATAEDCGSKEHIYGSRIDLHMDTYYECRQFGARDCLAFFLS